MRALHAPADVQGALCGPCTRPRTSRRCRHNMLFDNTHSGSNLPLAFCERHRFDAAALMHCMWRFFWLSVFGSGERWCPRSQQRRARERLGPATTCCTISLTKAESLGLRAARWRTCATPTAGRAASFRRPPCRRLSARRRRRTEPSGTPGGIGAGPPGRRSARQGRAAGS